MAGTIGVISDTHGLLRPEAVDALRGSELIIHAGDVGAADILDELRALAPVVAVKGNVDEERWARTLPRTKTIEFEGHKILVLHILDDLNLDPAGAGISAVVYGHSHKPSVEDREGVLYVNPGSAGPRRFKLPISVARMSVVDGRLTARIIEVGAASA
jgi:uncharacterized protein